MLPRKCSPVSSLDVLEAAISCKYFGKSFFDVGTQMFSQNIVEMFYLNDMKNHFNVLKEDLCYVL
jgi:hypothetical protein